nr:serine carboxypeptidase-like 11 [Malus domestica]
MADHQKALLERSEESHIKLNSMQTRINPKFQGLRFPKFGSRFYKNLLLHVWANDVNVQTALRVHKELLRCNSSSLPCRKYFQNVVSYHLSLNNRGYRTLIYRYSTKYSNNFMFATVKGEGHTALEYKPKECFVMFKRWISQKAL